MKHLSALFLVSRRGSGRSLGKGDGSPLQYAYLENSKDRGSWQTTVHGVTRAGHDLVTKPRPNFEKQNKNSRGVTAAAAAAESLQLHPTLRDPIDGSLPGSSVHGILQARTLEWVADSLLTEL